MNKKGFTLVELLVSIVILSLIMVFISTFILNLNNQKDDAQLDINLLVNQAAISKILNYDAHMYGIDTIECEVSKKCTITFKSGDLEKIIEITNNNKSIKYYDASNVYMVRTLTGSKKFGNITSDSKTDFENLDATFNKLVITFDATSEYNIEMYDYRLNVPYSQVTINKNGGDWDQNSFIGNTEIPALSQGQTYNLNDLRSLTRAGYEFNGWTTKSPSSINEDNIFTMGNSDAEIIANWIPITYYVKYNANGGSGTTATSTHTYDESKVLTANGFSKAGNTFTGWATSANGSAIYSNGAEVKNLTSTNGITINLFAKWSTNTYVVTLNNMGATEAGTESLNAVYGSNLPTITTPSMTNYAFGGYYTGQNGTGIQYISDLGKPVKAWNIDRNTTLYAKWTRNVFTITLNCNDGTEAIGTYECIKGEQYTINNLRNINDCGGYKITTSMIKYASSWSSASYTCNSDTTINANWSDLFSYSGNYEIINEGSNYWTLRATSTGFLTFFKEINVDVFLVGGGGGGGSNYSYYGGSGGGGGYTLLSPNFTFFGNQKYNLQIGSGGSAGNNGNGSNGGSTSVFTSYGTQILTANGGYGGRKGGTDTSGGAGGSGGGSGGRNSGKCCAGVGGSKGYNGGNAEGNGSSFNGSGGIGLGYPYTCEFHNINLPCYAGGGGGGAGYTSSSCDCKENYADSGAGENYGKGGSGGVGKPSDAFYPVATSGNSGIVVIRNAR